MKRIFVFLGGCSTEYGISLQSAHAVLEHMDPQRFIPVMVGITRKRKCLSFSELFQSFQRTAGSKQAAFLVRCSGLRQSGLLRLDALQGRLPFDAVFLVRHGKNGKNGTRQVLLELTGIPVIGCGMAPSPTRFFGWVSALP